VLIALWYLIPRTMGAVASIVVAPVTGLEDWFSESSAALPVYIRSRNELLAREHELARELAEHASAELSLVRIREENESLRTLLSATTSPRIAAGVIGRPSMLPYDVLLIDRGSDAGVREDAPVFAEGDQVIGFVARVFDDTAVVVLATTPGYQSTAYIYGPNIYTTAVGQGGGSLRVAVPQGINLSEGDLVVIPSLSRGVYGSISVVDTEPSRPEQYGYVSMDIPLASLEYVAVGTVPLRALSFEDAKAIVESTRIDLTTVPVPQGVLVDVEHGTTTATSTATTTESE
jgi:hypothetical protein